MFSQKSTWYNVINKTDYKTKNAEVEKKNPNTKINFHTRSTKIENKIKDVSDFAKITNISLWKELICSKKI